MQEPTLYITLKSYLAELKKLEEKKPQSQQRYVPTMVEIASEIGLSSTAISNISRNQIKQLTLVTGGKIIAAMQRRGYPMQVSDLIGYRPADGEQNLSQE